MLGDEERPVQRRSSRQVALERADYDLLVERHFRDAMTELRWPVWVQSNWLLAAMRRRRVMAISDSAFKRHAARVMKNLGWEKILNPDSKDGRWRAAGENFFVYGKMGQASAGRSKLRRELGW